MKIRHLSVVLIWLVYGLCYVASDYVFSRSTTEYIVQSQFEGSGYYVDKRPLNELWLLGTFLCVGSTVLLVKKDFV